MTINLKKYFDDNYESIEHQRSQKNFKWSDIAKEIKYPNKSDSLRAAYKKYRQKRSLDELYENHNKDSKNWKISSVWHKDKNTSIHFVPINNQEINYVEEFKQFSSSFKYEPLPPLEGCITDNVYVLALADLHIGKQKSDNYLKQIRNGCINLISKNTQNIKELVILNTGDMLHMDNIKNTTTKGTQLEADESFETVFTTTLNFIVSLIQDLLPYTPRLTFVNVRGNHDYNTSYCVGEALKLYYGSSPVINILNSASNRLYFNSCGNAFLFSHGDKALNKLPLIFATEGSDSFSKANHRHILLGHLHHTQSKEYFTDQMEFMGIDCRVINSPCKTDRYHSEEGYIGAKKIISLFGYNKLLGKFSEYIQPIF